MRATAAVLAALPSLASPRLFAERPVPLSDPVAEDDGWPSAPSLSPTVTPTDETLAAYGALREAPASAAFASVRLFCALVRLDRSAARRVDDALLVVSSLSVACAA